MGALNKMLDKIKETRSLSSDAALGRCLHVSRATISNWRHGTTLPDAVACADIAKLAGMPKCMLIGQVNAERARSRRERDIWLRIATAATIVIGIATSMPTIGSQAYAKAMPFMQQSYPTIEQAEHVLYGNIDLQHEWTGWKIRRGVLISPYGARINPKRLAGLLEIAKAGQQGSIEALPEKNL